MNSTRLAIVLLLTGAGITTQAASLWKAGVAQSVITPEGPIWMAGYGSRKKPSEGVRRDLYVKALAIQDEAGKTAVLVTADLLGFNREVADAITELCQAQYGLPREAIVLNASHTHSAGIVHRSAFPVFALSEEQNQIIDRYSKRVIAKTVDTVGKAIAGLAPAALDYGQGMAGIAANRRHSRVVSLSGPVDQEVPVLTVHNPGGDLRAIVVGYAAHATTLSDFQISGDWSGYAQEEIEKAHPGAVALFVQGCGADCSPMVKAPKAPRSVEISRMHGYILAAAVDQVLAKKTVPLTGRLETAFRPIDLPFQQIPPRKLLEKQRNDMNLSAAKRHYAQKTLDRLDRGEKLAPSYSYPVQVWQIGNELTFVVLGGEVVVDYSLRLKAELGWGRTWVAGYSNDVFGYVPSLRVLKEGGYEGGDANGHLPGPFSAVVEEMIVETVHNLARITVQQ